jgi:hypothetical protein
VGVSVRDRVGLSNKSYAVSAHYATLASLSHAF